ncbi:group III truncated hemoglobin [Polaribacter sp. R77954]|uniref:group III truncated hemoglobin n=1 Tax=Polaribacter sp. R77954 TaxID=3093870 RepID=UPI0037C6E8CA
MVELKDNFKPDISSRADIKQIITRFYDKLLNDEKMLPFFQEIVQKNQLEQHLEIITDFWNDILFDTLTYTNNVMQKHVDVNVLVSFNKAHFSIWVSYFIDTINTLFYGENSERMKSRAQSIATVMQLKMKLYQ